MEVVVYVTVRLATTSSTMRTAKKRPRASPAGTSPNDPISATGSHAASTPADTSPKASGAALAACPTSSENPLNSTVNATITYTGTSKPKNRRAGMRDAVATVTNSKAHSPKPIQERTKNSVTEYAASSTIFTRASHACTAEVPGMYELTLIRMLAVCHNGVSRATTRVTIPRDQRAGSPFACPGRGLSSR